MYLFCVWSHTSEQYYEAKRLLSDKSSYSYKKRCVCVCVCVHMYIHMYSLLRRMYVHYMHVYVCDCMFVRAYLLIVY